MGSRGFEGGILPGPEPSWSYLLVLHDGFIKGQENVNIVLLVLIDRVLCQHRHDFYVKLVVVLFYFTLLIL